LRLTDDRLANNGADRSDVVDRERSPLHVFDRETPPYREGDLVNWAAISAYVTGPAGAAAYARDVLGKTPTELSAQLSEHSVVLAMIAGQKYQHVRLAMNNLLLAATCLVVLMLELGVNSSR